MDKHQRTKCLIFRCFERFENEQIKYAILRKVKEIMEGKAHDIDMVIEKTKVKEARKFLLRVAAECGWMLVMESWKDSGNLLTIHFASVSECDIAIVHFDLFLNFSWNGYLMLENEQLLEGTKKRHGAYCVSDTVEMTTKLISRYIYHGKVKEEYRKELSAYCRSNPDGMEKTLRHFLTQSSAEKIVSYVMKSEWSELENINEGIRLEIKAAAQKNLFAEFANKVKAVKMKINRYLKPGGICIAFLGTDGSGKTTIINALPEVLKNTFDESQISYHHWRPGFLASPKGKNSGSLKDANEPHSQKLYSPLVSLGKFFYYNFDFVLGYWFCIRVSLAKNELVIFDRYYYDYLLDKYRYRLDIPDWLIRFCICFIPKPEVVFLLTGDAETIYQRKKELSIEDVRGQMTRIEQIKNIIPNATLIRTDTTIDQCIQCVSKEILTEMNNHVVDMGIIE